MLYACVLQETYQVLFLFAQIPIYWDSKQETFFQLLRRLHESSKENDFFPEVKVPRAFQGILFQEPLIKYLKNEDIYYRSRL